MTEKRVFFALDIRAPWPEILPRGRVLSEENRHLTIAFLGITDADKLLELIPQMPLPGFSIGLSGFFNECLFLPRRRPHVVAWNANFMQERKALDNYQGDLCRWLNEKGFHVHLHEEFLTHVTVCRTPFSMKDWRRSFSPLPFLTGDLKLFESLGSSKYAPLWAHSFPKAFEEIHHTADIAFLVRGGNLQDLFQNAKIALSFQFPPLLSFISEGPVIQTLDEIIFELNRLIALADENIGCPFKAVSYHGELVQALPNNLSWEMIVDV